jgi:hypothetical protein
VGAVVPTSSGLAGAAAGGVASNILGQILGNGLTDKSLLNLDLGQALVSGFSGASGALASSALRVTSMAGEAAIGAGADAFGNALGAPFTTGPIDFCRVATGKTCTLENMCGGR